MKNGRGKLEYASGAIFEGEFRNDKVTGKGAIQYPNKDRYEGDFVDGVKWSGFIRSF